jgi:serine/threonine-protein kinase
MASTKVDGRTFQKGLAPCLNCGHENPGGGEPLSVFSCQRCGASVISPMRIRTYWLYQPLGGGGMGSVYKAVQEGSGREFAVKVLPREGRGNPVFIQALQREGKAGAAIGRHPHIVPVVETGSEGNEPFIVTEFANGNRLDQLIDQHGPMPERVAVEIVRQLVDAEIHICRQGYLFRDMKPENVMYSAETETVKLFDFGLCLPLAEVASAHHAASDDLEGSPFYLPPERIVGAPEGEYSEVYSLGMLLFYLLTGRNYYSQGDIEKLVTKHVSSLRVSSVSNRLQHCNPQLVPVVDKMIARTPNQRFPDLASLHAALDNAFSFLRKTGPQAAVSAGPTATAMPPVQDQAQAVNPAKRRHRQQRQLITLGAAAAVFLLVVGGWILARHLKVAKVRQILRQETAARFGVTADVKPPSLSIAEVEQIAAQRVEPRFTKKARDIADFDERTVEKAVCASLGITSLQRHPEKSIADLDAEINRQTADAVEREIAKTVGAFSETTERERIVRELGLRLPLPAPTESPEAAEKALREKVAAAVAEKYPTRILSERVKQAMEANRSYRIGETITLYDQNSLEVTGRYLGREGDKIVIGDRKLLVGDLPTNMMWKFSDTLSQERVSRALVQVREDFQRERQQYAQTLMKEQEKPFFQERGFIQLNGTWQNPTAGVEEKLAQARTAHATRQEAAKREIRDRITSRFDRSAILRENGYVQVDGQWQAEDQAVKNLLEQRRQEFTRQRQAQLARILQDTEKEVQDEVFREQGYVWIDGRWQGAHAIIEQMVARDLERRLAMP